LPRVSAVVPMWRWSTALALLLLAGCAAATPPGEPAGLCLARLDRAGIAWKPVATPVGHGGCAVDNPVEVSAAGIAWNQPGVVSCGFALALDAFLSEDVEAAARARFGESVRLLRHFGTYACRRESSGSGRWSQHAQGKAIDIAGFELSDGTVILVARDWWRRGPKRDFLHEVAQRACRRFGVVLTPDSDRAHRNHIHIDDGPYKLCGA
jgi:hypothetical protein